MRGVVALLGLGLVAGCASNGSAPVIDKAGARPQPAPASQPASPRIEASTTGFHSIARGDTLYAIAFANGLDFREIAAWNQLDNPDRILVGQRLRLTPPPGAVEVKPLGESLPLQATPLGVPLDDEPSSATGAGSTPPGSAPARTAGSQPGTPAPSGASIQKAAASAAASSTVSTAAPSAGATKPAPVASALAWQWPVDGVLAARFGGAGGKGIDIVAPRLTEIRAASAGKVVYSGNGLRGYGRLLIVKHAGDYLSAYAHNDSILVKEGDSVAAGQVIARMGDSDSDRVKLHFEIRRYGKPLDPLAYLPERS
jgi:lipoprotein NlpD